MPSGDFEINVPEIKLPKLGKNSITLVVIAVLGLWLLNGFYKVEADELGVVLRFGKLSNVTEPGLNYHLPFPVESVETPKVTEVKRVEIGFRTIYQGPPSRYEDMPEESLMLTGDENIVDVELVVQYRVTPGLVRKALFNVRGLGVFQGQPEVGNGREEKALIAYNPGT